MFGYVVGGIAGRVKRNSGILIVPAEGLFVEGTKCPLEEGEIEPTTSWAKKIVKNNM